MLLGNTTQSRSSKLCDLLDDDRIDSGICPELLGRRGQASVVRRLLVVRMFVRVLPLVIVLPDGNGFS